MPPVTTLLAPCLVLVGVALGTTALADDAPPGNGKEGPRTVPGMTVLLVDSREEPAEKHTDAERPTLVTARASGEFTVEEDGFLLGKVSVAFEEGVSASIAFHVHRNDLHVWSDGASVRGPRNSRDLDYNVRFSIPTRDGFAFPVRKGDVVKWSYSRSPYDLEPARFRAGAEFGRLAFRAFPPADAAGAEDE